MSFIFHKSGMCREVGLPSYGAQNRGVSPGGAQDQFSYRTGNLLLDNDPATLALEFIAPPLLEFTDISYFCLVGAAYREVRLDDQPLEHGRVYLAQAGQVLSFKKKLYGFRTYLCTKAFEKNDESKITGRTRGAFQDVAHWPARHGRIRIMKGPEFNLLNDADAFLNQSWQISREMSEMGIKLEGTELELKNEFNMISSPVAVGTIQLSPSGPIILMRDCQTVGGYPRIFSVSSSDVDLLAQMNPGQEIHFRMVDQNEARACLKQQKNDLVALQRKSNKN